MFESNKKLTAEELKGLYPKISLIEGYDRALVGVVTAPNDEFLPVYDTFIMIDIIAEMGFESKEALNEYFTKLVEKSKSGGFGPLFMHTVKVREPKVNKDSEEVSDDIFAEEEKPWGTWESESDSDSDSDSEYDALDYESSFESDSDSDSDSEDNVIYEDNSDEFEDRYDGEKPPFLQITMHIADNDPDMCQITPNPSKVRDALFMLFPSLSRLDIIKEIKVYFASTDEIDDEDE
jgi:hypothetical protein